MNLVRILLLCGLVQVVALLVPSSEGNRTISAEFGDNVTLTCKTSDVVDFEDVVVEWNRTDLGEFIFLYRDGRPDPEIQHPFYQDRVDLVHSQLMGGDLSVVLKNVRTNDSGTFECRLIQKMFEKRRKRSSFDTKPTSTIVMKFSGSGVWSISAHVGDNVTLPCNTSDVVDFEDVAVNWTRTDLGPDQYVFFYRDGRPDQHNQHPSYKDRVDLVHSHLTGGDLSVVLKNVTTNDSGTFECRLIQELGNKEKQFYSKLLSTIVLKVSDPGSTGNKTQTGDKGGHEDRQRHGLIGSVGFVVVLLLLSVGLWVFFHLKKQNSENPPENELMMVESGQTM